MDKIKSIKMHEVIVRQNSDISKKDLLKLSKRIANKKTNEDPLHMYYCQVFDSRDNGLYKVFSDDAVDKYNIKNSILVDEETNEYVEGAIIINDPEINKKIKSIALDPTNKARGL